VKKVALVDGVVPPRRRGIGVVGGRASRAMRQPAPKAPNISVALARMGLCHGARSAAIHPLSDLFHGLEAGTILYG